MPVDLKNISLVDSLPVKTIERANSYESGWYKIGNSENFNKGELYSVKNFPYKLVVWRGNDSEVIALNSYCPHMGAGLSCGQLEKEGVACPFHGWRWGEDGKCNFIPYSDSVPEKATTIKWSVMEDNNEVFIWYHSEKQKPNKKGTRLEIQEGEH